MDYGFSTQKGLCFFLFHIRFSTTMSNSLFSTHISLPYKQSACSDILRELSEMSKKEGYTKYMASLFKDDGDKGLLRIVAKDLVAVKSATQRTFFFGKKKNGIWILRDGEKRDIWIECVEKE